MGKTKKLLCMLLIVMMCMPSALFVAAASTVASTLYTVEGATVSDVPYYTPVETFLSNLTISGGDAARIEGAVNGYVTENSKLVVGDSEYAIALTESYYNANYDNFTAFNSDWTNTKISPYNSTNVTATIDTDAKKGGKSFKFTSNSANTADATIQLQPYNGKTFKTGAGVNIEFSFMTDDLSDSFKFEWKKDNWLTPFVIENGDIKINGTVVANYEVNKWYHFVLTMNIGEQPVLVYLNGEKIAKRTDGLTHYINLGAFVGFIGGGSTRFVVGKKAGKVTNFWVDDVKIYSANAYSYDAEAAGTKCTLTSDTYTITDNTINVPAGTSAETLNQNINKPDGATIKLFDTDGAQTETVSNGVKVVVVSKNGAAVKEYTVSMALISSNTYSVDDAAKKVSEVKHFTTVSDFLSNISAGNATKKVFNGAEEVTEGYICDGHVLRVNDGTEDCDYEIILNENIYAANFDTQSDLGGLEIVNSNKNITPASCYQQTTHTDKGGMSLKVFSLAESDEDNTTMLQKYLTAAKNTFNLEFSVMFEGADVPRGLVIKAGDSFWSGTPVYFANGVAKVFGETIFSYESNTWYNIVISMDTASRKYKVYINGEEAFQGIKTAAEGSMLDRLSYIRFYQETPKNTAGTMWLDDIKIYETALAPVYDAQTVGAACILENSSLNIYKNKIVFDNAATVNIDDIIAQSTISSGATAVKGEDTITVKSQNGLVMNKYKITRVVGETIKKVSEGVTTLTVPITSGNKSQPARLIVSISEGENLEKVLLSEQVTVDGEGSLSVNTQDNLDGKTLRVFVWNSLENLIPLK